MRKNKSFLGTGWSYPPQFVKQAKSVKMVSEEEDVKQSIFILLSTTPGERITNLAYGCNLHSILFQPQSSATEYLIEEVIRDAIIDFEPRVEVEDIQVNFEKVEDGLLFINLQYKVLLTNTRYNIVFPYYKLEGTNVDIVNG